MINMRNISKKTLINIGLILATFLVIFALMETKVINSYYGGIIVLILINIVLAVSLNLIVGFTGQLCLGHAGFMAIGAYVSAVMSVNMKLPFFLSIIVGGLIACVFAALIGFPTLKLKGDYFAITTLAFGEIIRVIIMNFDYVGGARGFSGIPRKTNFTIAFFAMVIAIVVIYNIIHSTQGRSMVAIRENEIAAEAMGVNAFKYKMMAFMVAAFFAGAAGALYAHYMGFIQPTSFDFVKSIDILTFVVLGGMGSLSGSVIATVILTFLPEGLRDFKELRMIIYPISLIVIMIFRPQGLLGDKELSLNVLGKFKKRKEA